MKKAFKRAAIGLALALTFMGAVEFNGYHMLDRKDGGNVLYENLHDSRALTQGEITIARSVFGNSIDYGRVRIFNRPYFEIFGRQNTLVTPNGNIYIADKDYMADFSTQSASRQSLFMHEMTHVWQFQNGQTVRWNAIKGWIGSGFNYHSLYDYKLSDTTDFARENLEQQAHMVEDYYNDRENLKGWDASDPIHDTMQAEKNALEQKIKQALPLPDVPTLKPPAPQS